MTSKTVVGWRIWYTNDREYSQRDTDWSELPDDGVLALALYYDSWNHDNTIRHKMVLTGDDHYFHDPESDIYGCNNDPIDEITERYDIPTEYIKRGKWTDSETMDSVHQQARDSEW